MVSPFFNQVVQTLGGGIDQLAGRPSGATAQRAFRRMVRRPLVGTTILEGLGLLELDPLREQMALEETQREENKRLAQAAKMAQALFNASIMGPGSIFSVLQGGLS